MDNQKPRPQRTPKRTPSDNGSLIRPSDDAENVSSSPEKVDDITDNTTVFKRVPKDYPPDAPTTVIPAVNMSDSGTLDITSSPARPAAPRQPVRGEYRASANEQPRARYAPRSNEPVSRTLSGQPQQPQRPAQQRQPRFDPSESRNTQISSPLYERRGMDAVQNSRVSTTGGAPDRSAHVSNTQNPQPQRESHIENSGSAPNRTVSSRSAKGARRRASSTGAPPRSRRVTTGNQYDLYPDTSEYEGGHGMLSSVMKAIIYIVFVLVCSGFLSYYAIMVGNDVFALVKSSEEITLTVPEYATINDIAKLLDDNDVIKYPSMFKLYARLRKKSNVEFVAGTYTVTPSQGYDDLIRTFRNIVGSDRETVRITFKEGATIDEMIEIFVENGISTREALIDAIQNADFSDYWFVKELTDNGYPEARKYRLEGYLFPDTYDFYTDSTARAAIAKLLDNFSLKFDEQYKESCDAIGMSVDDVVTLASMIQSEAKYVQEYTTISSVFHNRLSNPSYETQGYLSSDATIQYALDERKSVLSGDDTKIDNPYNTYKYKGLPPGAICNPSLNALNAALYPEETNYFYFVAASDGTNLFATTYNEHLTNINTARGN